MSKTKQQSRRRYFTGKLSGFESKAERNFQKKNLKAYIQGKQWFVFGRNPDYLGRPMYYKTSEEWREES